MRFILAALALVGASLAHEDNVESPRVFNSRIVARASAPTQNADGSCASYTIKSGDYCGAIASAYSLTVTQITAFNNGTTWGWSGCNALQIGQIICLSTGSSPMPAPVNGAVCGPTVPGTAKPAAGTDLSTLNPCPLNACCSVWGQCGTTADFCTNTTTGNPGTAAPGTNGCISNCGTNIVFSSAPTQYRKIGFYQGSNLNRPCLYETASQINASLYTHLVFAFATISPSYALQIPDKATMSEFQKFLKIQGPKKILSIGGWDFSTSPSTYNIFRQAVTADNRKVLINYIVYWVYAYGLDGVNIDWEYPGAPDIPGIPPGNANDGMNYLAFLWDLRYALGNNKEISIATPPTYWYLKLFPIKMMSLLCDYIIHMTYDFHGQGDAGSQYSQDGCPGGNCLRSHVNITETLNSLSMITKAGVASNKVVVGVTSYGKGFGMSKAGCYGPSCTFLGGANQSYATPGPCTQTAGILANAEIKAIIANSTRVQQNFFDSASNTNILVYDQTQWVGWMDDNTKMQRNLVYQYLLMGGSVDWSLDEQQYNPPPTGSTSWSSYIASVKAGGST